jgi:hypothetical protein
LARPLSPAEQARLNATLESARQPLSAADRSTAFKHGASLTLEQAIEFALEHHPE